MLPQLGGMRNITMPFFSKLVYPKQRYGNFSNFKMAADAILDCRICKILLADNVWRSQTYYCTKFRQNRLSCYWDIAIFQTFKMAATAFLDFWNRDILLANRVHRVETHQHAKFRQHRSTGCKDIKIFPFFKMATILDCRICKILLADGVWRAQTHHCTKFVKIGQSVRNILRFFNFLKWRPSTILDSFGAYLYHPQWVLGVSIILQNMVIIDAVVFII